MSERGMSRVEFVRLGALAGMVPVVSALAACGAEEPSGGGGGGGSPEPTREPTAEPTQNTPEDSAPETTDEPANSGGGGYIALESEVPPGSAVEFEDGGEPAVLLRLDSGDFVAYSAVCTHQGCTVAYNGSGGTLDCPCHGSVFEPCGGGAVRQGPAESPLPGIPVETSGGEVRLA